MNGCGRRGRLSEAPTRSCVQEAAHAGSAGAAIGASAATDAQGRRPPTVLVNRARRSTDPSLTTGAARAPLSEGSSKVESILVLAPHEDRPGRAARLAGQLATRTGARVVLLRVLEEKLGGGAPGDTTESQRQIRQLLVEVETQQVEELAADLRSEGVEVSVEVCWGVPWEAVLERVQRDGHDLVVKPASGLVRRGHVFFGATALHLFRKCPCPVWVVGNDARPPERILAAIDPRGAEHRRRIASRILDWADTVAEWSHGEVHVGTAWYAGGEDVLRDRIGEAEWKDYVDEARAGVAEDLDSALVGRAVSEDRVHLVHGVAHEVLPELAREREFDLIVMGTLGREGPVGDELGETAETMIREVRCSVLTIPSRDRTDES